MSSDAKVAAYKDMLQSDGWRYFLEDVDAAWGADACIRKIDDALEGIEPGDDGNVTVLQIRAAARQIHRLLKVPGDLVSRATGQAQKPSRAPFWPLRRTTR